MMTAFRWIMTAVNVAVGIAMIRAGATSGDDKTLMWGSRFEILLLVGNTYLIWN